MARVRMTLCAMIVMAVLGMGLLGCPANVGVHLLVSPESLECGHDKDELILTVSKTYTTNQMEPLVVTSNVDWLIPLNCQEPADRCVSSGPYDQIPVRVRIDRSKTVLGLNTGMLSLMAGQAATVQVPVAVDEIAQADFTSDIQYAEVNQLVSFQDMSRVTATSGAVVDWQWRFGDGAISTLANPTHRYSQPGDYEVSLAIRTKNGITRTVVRPAFIQIGNISGQVDFVASKTNLLVGESVLFTDTSTLDHEPVTSREWKFGDGASSSEASPSHIYRASGVYSVTLTLTNNTGSLTKTKEGYILVRSEAGPRVDFAYDTAYVAEKTRFYDLTAEGQGTVIGRLWNFGDNHTSTEKNPAHIYAKRGNYKVSLVVSTEHGAETREKEIQVRFRSPKVDFDAQPRRQLVDDPIHFMDLSVPGYGETLHWRWFFGDGNTSTEKNPVHRYAQAGVYTVKLQVTTGDSGANPPLVADELNGEMVKEDFITIINPPKPGFTWTPRLALVNDEITFVADQSEGLEEDPIVEYTWDFGDGTQGEGIETTHTYSRPGNYPVTLSVITATGGRLLTREVAVDLPPDATFTATPQPAYAVVDAITFTLGEQPEGARPIARYFWDLGDGMLRFEATPSHTYAQPGNYRVRLAAYYRHSAALSTDAELRSVAEKNITVLAGPPLSIDAPQWAFIGDDVVFGVNTQPQATPITQYYWDFGDGSSSEEAAPIHVYQATGVYTVRLTVVAEALAEPYRTRSAEMSISIVEESDLDRYISFDDGCFDENPVFSTHNITQMGQVVARAYLIDRMTSQCWNPDNAIHEDYVEWTHPVTIIDPIHKIANAAGLYTAMLFIDGGSRTSTAQVEDFAWQIAVLSGTPVVHIKNVPYQPIVYLDEVIPNGEEDNYTGNDLALRPRTEDASIAYTYEKYLRSYRETNGNPTPEWPLLYPMTKAAVKAMDVAATLLETEGDVALDGFIVSGASKRGWTTWLAGAADQRVKAIAPIVINVLNMRDTLIHHRASYGYWSPAIYDYAEKGIFDQLIPMGDDVAVSPEAQALLNRVDPHAYVLANRYPIPKFMLNATGDEFFIPDTAPFYFDDLLPERHQSYVPNVGHGMGGLDSDGLGNPDNPVGMFMAWYMAVSQEQPLPQFSYTFEKDGAIRVEVAPGSSPVSARLWQATSQGRRDFRNPILGAQWTSTPLAPQGDGVYVAKPSTPAPGDYKAFFIQLEFPNSAQMPSFPPTWQLLLNYIGFTSPPNMTFSSGVRILPVDADGAPVYPDFTGYVANQDPARPFGVPFPESKLPVIVAYGTPYEMGYYYGQLLAHEINAFIPEFVAAYLDDTGNTLGALENAWVFDRNNLDKRMLDEIQGIADGVLDTLGADTQASLKLIELAHSAAMRDKVSLWTTSSTAAYRQMLQDGNAAHAVSFNGPLYRQLHQYQCAVMYIPDAGLPHLVFTYAGLAFGRTGVNLNAVSACEVADPEGGDLFDPHRRNAMPQMRGILYDALSLRDAIDVLEASPPRRRTTVVFSDGRNERRGALLRMNAAGAIIEKRFDLALDHFQVNLPGIVYRTEPKLENTLLGLLARDISALTLQKLLNITTSELIAKPGENLLNVVYSTPSGYALNVYVGAAQGDAEAYRDPFDVIQLHWLLP